MSRSQIQEKPMKLPGPDHPITIAQSEKLIVVSFHGEEIARTARALELKEASYPTVYYIPRDDVRMDLMAPSERQTYCPYKGDATYRSLSNTPGDGLDAVWSYEQPYPAMEQIREHLAFYTDQVEIVTSPLN
jgi:uncharacterized protein (DUF427 family)